MRGYSEPVRAHLTTDQREALERMARQQQRSLASVVREAVARMIDDERDRQPV